MKNVLYNSDMDFNEILVNARGRYEPKIFLVLFLSCFFVMSCLPIDIVMKESEVIVKLLGSVIISFCGGYITKEVCKKLAKRKLFLISKALEEDNVHILEEDLEKALLSSVDTIEDRISKADEIISYFLVLDRDKQIKVLESIKTDLYDGTGRFRYNSLYLLNDAELKCLSIPKDEIDELILRGNNEKNTLQRKLKK